MISSGQVRLTSVLKVSSRFVFCSELRRVKDRKQRTLNKLRREIHLESLHFCSYKPNFHCPAALSSFFYSTAPTGGPNESLTQRLIKTIIATNNYHPTLISLLTRSLTKPASNDSLKIDLLLISARYHGVMGGGREGGNMTAQLIRARPPGPPWVPPATVATVSVKLYNPSESGAVKSLQTGPAKQSKFFFFLLI